MALARKMMGFPVRTWSHFRQNYRQRDMRKSISHFLQGRSQTETQKVYVNFCLFAHFTQKTLFTHFAKKTRAEWAGFSKNPSRKPTLQK